MVQKIERKILIKNVKEVSLSDLIWTVHCMVIGVKTPPKITSRLDFSGKLKRLSLSLQTTLFAINSPLIFLLNTKIKWLSNGC